MSASKVILTYESKSHGKRRYFVSEPKNNPKQDGKPEWSYEKKDALVLTPDKMKGVQFMCNLYGYNDLEVVAAGPKLTVVNGGLDGDAEDAEDKPTIQ